MSDPLDRLSALAEKRGNTIRAQAEACRDYLQANFTAEQRAHMNQALDRFGGSIEIEGVGRISRQARAA